jgi:outer membrane protein TolC
MKTLQTLLIVVGVTAVSARQARAEGPTRISFEEAIERAVERPTMRAEDAAVAEAEAGASAAFRGAWLPVVGVTAEALWRTEEVGFDTPVGAFVFQPGDLVTAGVEVRQPLIRPEGWLFEVPAAERDAAAARASQKRRVEELRAEAAQAYFTVLEVRARLDAIGPLVDALEAQRERVEALLKVDRVTRDDLLRVEVALDQARLGQRELERSLAVAEHALGRAIGERGRITAGAAPQLADAETRGWEGRREDLRALDAVAEAARDRRAGVYTSLLPTVEAFGRAVYTNQEGLNENQWFEGGLSLTWTPFEAGTRWARADIEEARAVRAEARRREAEEAIAVQLADVEARLETARDRLEVETRSVKQANEAARILRARYEAGGAILPELLDAESEVAERRTARALAELAVARLLVDQALAAGAM